MRRGVCQSYLVRSLSLNLIGTPITEASDCWLFETYCNSRVLMDFREALRLMGVQRAMLGMDFLEGGVSGGYVVKRWPARRCCLHSRENKASEALAFFCFFPPTSDPCFVPATAISSQSLPRCVEPFSVWVEHFYNIKHYCVCESTI